MSRLLSTVVLPPFSPADMAKEILAISRQFGCFINSQDALPQYSPEPTFFSLPAFPEFAAPANVILEALGGDVGEVDMTQADACVFSLPRYSKPDLTDMPPPRNAEELSELLDRLAARLEAVAWDIDGLRALRPCLDENPNEGVQVYAALRLIAKYSLDNGCPGRD